MRPPRPPDWGTMTRGQRKYWYGQNHRTGARRRRIAQEISAIGTKSTSGGGASAAVETKQLGWHVQEPEKDVEETRRETTVSARSWWNLSAA